MAWGIFEMEWVTLLPAQAHCTLHTALHTSHSGNSGGGLISFPAFLRAFQDATIGFETGFLLPKVYHNADRGSCFQTLHRREEGKKEREFLNMKNFREVPKQMESSFLSKTGIIQTPRTVPRRGGVVCSCLRRKYLTVVCVVMCKHR